MWPEICPKCNLSLFVFEQREAHLAGVTEWGVYICEFCNWESSKVIMAPDGWQGPWDGRTSKEW